MNPRDVVDRVTALQTYMPAGHGMIVCCEGTGEYVERKAVLAALDAVAKPRIMRRPISNSQPHEECPDCRGAGCEPVDPAPARPPADTGRGLYRKFIVERTDGSSASGGKHEHCRYFVLDLDHDRHAPATIRAYADSCRSEYPALAADLDRMFPNKEIGEKAANEQQQHVHPMTLRECMEAEEPKESAP